jgi:chemotaxis family two-component system response regulator Rcp1
MNILETGASCHVGGDEQPPGPAGFFAFADTMAQPETSRLVALLAEDNPADVLLVEEAITSYRLPLRLHVVRDGELAADYFKLAESDQSVPCPSLLILDLNLPKLSGKEVLQRVRSGVKCRNIPVLIITSSDLRGEREQLKMLGADRYFRKPIDYDQFLKIGLILRELIERIEPR